MWTILASSVISCAPRITVGEPVQLADCRLVPVAVTTRYVFGANLRSLHLVEQKPDGSYRLVDCGSATASAPLSALLPGGAAQAIHLMQPVWP